MLHALHIVNNRILLDTNTIQKSLTKDTLYKTYNNIDIYCIDNVCFCNVSGMLRVYCKKNRILKMTMSSLDYTKIFNISNVNGQINLITDTLKRELRKLYKEENNSIYYNKYFNFIVKETENSYRLLIERR